MKSLALPHLTFLAIRAEFVAPAIWLVGRGPCPAADALVGLLVEFRRNE
jgi:hypothetical protein